MSVESLGTVPDARIIWRFSFGLMVFVLAAALLSPLPFWDGMTDMWNVWVNYPEYSHSLLIPPIAVFLIWQQKDRLELMTFDGSWWGVVLVACGGLFLFLGQLGTLYVLVEYGYVITLFGLALAFTGGRAFRLIAAPFLILLFMIPLPSFLYSNLSSKLQLVSSQIGVAFIRLFGISVFAEGNVIDLGGYKLQVAEACDGLRYLFPLLTMGFLIAYFYKGAGWKRAVIFLSSIPVTVLMNSFRIGTIGVMVEHWGISMAEGFLHEFQGWLVFMASAGLLLGEAVCLNRIGGEKGSWRQRFGVELPSPSPRNGTWRSRSVPRPFIAACIVLGGFIIANASPRRPPEAIPGRSSFLEYPMQLGPWSGHRESLDAVYIQALRFDDYLLADYAAGGVPVNLYMAYYDSQRKGEAVHSPRSCLPGGGWQLTDFNQRSLAIEVAGRPLRVNRTLIALGSQRELVYYWFEQRGRVITNEFMVKFYLFWDALKKNRTDGALIRLTTLLPAASSEADADARLSDMAARIAPTLIRYVPN